MLSFIWLSWFLCCCSLLLILFPSSYYILGFFFFNVGLHSINPLHSTVLLSHKWVANLFIFISFKESFYLSLISSLTQLPLSSVFFSFLLLEVFSIFYQWLISIFMFLWSKKIFCTTSIFVNLDLFEFYHNICCILENVPCVLTRKEHLFSFEGKKSPVQQTVQESQ